MCMISVVNSENAMSFLLTKAKLIFLFQKDNILYISRFIDVVLIFFFITHMIIFQEIFSSSVLCNCINV